MKNKSIFETPNPTFLMEIFGNNAKRQRVYQWVWICSTENKIPPNPFDYHHFPQQNSHLGVYSILRHPQIHSLLAQLVALPSALFSLTSRSLHSRGQDGHISDVLHLNEIQQETAEGKTLQNTIWHI